MHMHICIDSRRAIPTPPIILLTIITQLLLTLLKVLPIIILPIIMHSNRLSLRPVMFLKPWGGGSKNHAWSIRSCVSGDHIFWWRWLPDLRTEVGDEFKNTLAQGPYEPGYLKTFFLHNDVFSIELELTTGAVKPEGENQAPSTRIRHPYIFNTSSTSIDRCGHL